MEDKINSFKKELKELLEKYNAEIYVELIGDTHDVSSDLVVDVDNKEAIRINDCLSHYDIKVN